MRTCRGMLAGLLGGIATSLVIAASPALAASAEPSGLDPEMAAKVAREKVKQRANRQRGGNAGNGSSDRCGYVDIGNDNTERSASRRLSDRSRTVIVTGDVINAARCD
jgi:hypothetical protein